MQADELNKVRDNILFEQAKIRLNCKNGYKKHLLKHDILGVNKGLFTNDCKKVLKYV